MSILTANDISVSINDIPIIHNCSLTAEKGEFIGIIGPNGSGKTTFLKTLRGILPSQSGQIQLYDKPLHKMGEKIIARHMGFMQQSIDLGFGYSAKEIVMSARYPYLKWWENEGPEDERIVEQAMEFVGVSHLKDNPINTLSGGERQRVLLAKILAQETDILLLDEPTAALDMVYADEMFRYCRQLADQGKTVIVVVHDLEMAAKFCTRLVLFSEGKIIDDGTPCQVLHAENLKKAFHLSSCVYADPFFKQVRIFVYPNGQEDISCYRQDERALPADATIAIIDKDELK